MSVFLRTAVRNGKSVKISIVTEGDGYKRAVGAIGPQFLTDAANKVAAAVEAGTAFKDSDFMQMEDIRIQNMNHTSKGDRNAHYSVEGWSFTAKIKDVHVAEDPSKQTVSFNPGGWTALTLEQRAN